MKGSQMSQIKSSVTMYHVLLHLGLFDRLSIKLKDPFDPETDKWNFSIAPSGRTWTRHAAARESGSVIDFYAKLKGISPAEAAKELDEEFAVTAEHPMQKGFLTEKLDALRGLIGDNPEVEALFVETVKASYINGKEAASWPMRFTRFLSEGLQSVYMRARQSRNSARQEVRV